MSIIKALLPYVISLFSGGLFLFAFAPFGFWQVAIIGFSIFAYLLYHSNHWLRALLICWIFSAGYFVAGSHWMLAPFIPIESNSDILFISGVMGLLTLYMPFFTATGSLIAYLFGRRFKQPLSYILLLACCWTLGEWFLGNIWTRYPWQLIGYIWSDVLPIMQITSVIGIYGLSLITVVIIASPSLLFFPTRKTNWKMVISIYVLFAALWSFGIFRLAFAEDIERENPIRMRLVQTKEPDNFSEITPEQDLKNKLALTTQRPLDEIDILIWPEDGVHYIISNIPARTFTKFIPFLKEQLPSHLFFITGQFIGDFSSPDLSFPDKLWNGASIIKGDKILATDKKHHLVPYSEYVPSLIKKLFTYPPILDSVKRLGYESGDSFNFLAGEDIFTIQAADLPPVSILICYELAFPEEIVDQKNRPEWILNLSSDAYFQNTTQLAQIFEIGRFRAIEQGLPVVRVVNEGQTGVIDSYGRIITRTLVNENIIIDENLPRALGKATFYARFGDNIFFFITMMFIIGLVILERRGN